MGYLSQFLHGLGSNFLKLRPDQSIIAGGNSDSYDAHIQSTLANDNSFALIYSASDAPYVVNLTKLKARPISVIWYNPRTHEYQTKNSVQFSDKVQVQEFDPPGESGAGNDWVLILGDKKVIQTDTSR